MSSALAQAARLTPEIRLAQAVSQFEASLSSDQKATLRTYRSQMQKSPPNPSDVMRLTAEIDLRTAGNLGSRRCFGPRMTNFLHAIQQFAFIGDVMIGGSQNLIACGVWSLVRMLLLSIVNFSSYFEKLSSLLMNAGRSAPRYQSIGFLYPRSKRLQSHLAEYFIVVVHLCHTLFKFTQKSTLGQFASSLSDSELKSYQSDLDVWAISIKEEVSVLSAKTIEEEAEQNTRLRALWIKDSKIATLEQRLKTKSQVLDLYSTYDYETSWKQNRKVGSATIFNTTAEYQDWKNERESCTLLYTGKLGSGKSVLLASIIDDLNLFTNGQNITVAYFFCRYDIPESLNAETIIRSLLRQLLLPISDLTTLAKQLEDATASLSFDRLFNSFQSATPSTYRAYFILDGLDECDQDQIEELISLLRKLQERYTIQLCISLRSEPKGNTITSLENFVALRRMSIPENNPDIERFLAQELEHCMLSKKLVIGDPTLILEIQDALLRGSQGMFLWAALQVTSLCAMKTDDAIRQALLDLPKDLEETFTRILKRSNVQGQPYQKRILQLITVAQRPLHVEELREALSVIPGNTTWNRATLINEISSTLGSCGSVIMINEEELTVRFVHHSVKQFLVTSDSTSIGFTNAEAHSVMTQIIITYLNYNVFETQISTVVTPKIMTGSVPSKVIRSTFDSSSTVQSIALRLLRADKGRDYDAGQIVVEERRLFNNHEIDKFHFYDYAKLYWKQHMSCTLKIEPFMNNLLLRSLHKLNNYEDNLCGYNQIPLFDAVVRGDEALVRLLVTIDEVNADSRDKKGQPLLFIAAREGHEGIVRLLLAIGKVDADSRDIDGRSPLSRAAGYGREGIVKLLLATGKVDADSRANDGVSPLSSAAAYGREGTVNLLLATGKVDADSRQYEGWSPLSYAAMSGHEGVVKVLLATGKVDADSRDNEGWSPLSHAAWGGYEGVVKLLLATGKVDTEFRNSTSQSPLSIAKRKKHKAIVKLLEEYIKTAKKT